MGLFSRKRREPVLHPAVARRIVVAAPLDAVAAQLDAYSEVQSPRHAAGHELRLHRREGDTVVALPDRLHPWAFHNLAFWLLDTPGADGGIQARADGGPHAAGYTLVADPELADCLCGLDDRGQGITVLVPTNDLVAGEDVPAGAEAPTPPLSPPDTIVTVLLEDPQHDMNPANEPTRRRRSDLRAPLDVTMLY